MTREDFRQTDRTSALAGHGGALARQAWDEAAHFNWNSQGGADTHSQHVPNVSICDGDVANGTHGDSSSGRNGSSKGHRADSTQNIAHHAASELPTAGAGTSEVSASSGSAHTTEQQQIASITQELALVNRELGTVEAQLGITNQAGAAPPESVMPTPMPPESRPAPVPPEITSSASIPPGTLQPVLDPPAATTPIAVPSETTEPPASTSPLSTVPTAGPPETWEPPPSTLPLSTVPIVSPPEATEPPPPTPPFSTVPVAGPADATPAEPVPPISTVLAANPSESAPPATNSGNFTVANGQIISPNGQTFIAKGINVAPSLALADQSQILQDYPGLNMIRLNAVPSTDSPAEVQQVIDAFTSKGIVVEVEDHTSSGNEGNASNVVTGSALTSEEQWYSQIASANVNNPNVWFGSANEPNDPSNPQGVVDQETGIYNAVRSAGNNNMIEMELNGGVSGAPMQGDPSAFASMTNIAFDAHFYGWEANFSTDQGTVNQSFNSLIQQAQSVTSAQGTVPVIIGEYGNSGSDTSIAPNASQVIAAVTQSGFGSDAWQWEQFGNPTSGADSDNDSLIDGNGNVTAYGQQIAQYINGGAGSSA
jgi:hypothetical protein